jgi:hypothetical protein
MKHFTLKLTVNFKDFFKCLRISRSIFKDFFANGGGGSLVEEELKQQPSNPPKYLG